MDNEMITLSEAPITITRTFKLGDYKNLKVNVIPSELDAHTKWTMMVENVCDAYAQLFIHQMITAELYDGDIAIWKEKLFKLDTLRQKLLKEE